MKQGTRPCQPRRPMRVCGESENPGHNCLLASVVLYQYTDVQKNGRFCWIGLSILSMGVGRTDNRKAKGHDWFDFLTKISCTVSKVLISLDVLLSHVVSVMMLIACDMTVGENMDLPQRMKVGLVKRCSHVECTLQVRNN